MNEESEFEAEKQKCETLVSLLMDDSVCEEKTKSIPEEHKATDILTCSEKRVSSGSEYHPTHSLMDFIF